MRMVLRTLLFCYIYRLLFLAENPCRLTDQHPPPCGSCIDTFSSLIVTYMLPAMRIRYDLTSPLLPTAC